MRIRRGLGSRRLPCGCIAGIYETYRDEVVTIVDARATGCVDPDHLAGTILPTLVTGADRSVEPSRPIE